MKHLLDEETISRMTRRSKDPAAHLWECPICGNIPPLLLSTGWYVRRPCSCQRRRWQEQDQRQLPRTLDEALRLAQHGQTYTWLGRERTDEGLRHQTFATFDRARKCSKGVGMNDFQTSSPSTLTYTILEAANVLRLSRAKVYRLIEQEGLPTVRFGRAVRVPVDSLQDWLKERIQKDALPTSNRS